MLAKINSAQAAIFALALVVLLSGCTPAGPRALLKGKKLLDRGDVAGAVTQFRRATSLLATNAAAWNYFGVALQESGQLDEAVNAYQNALRFDHELAEAHFNLGLLYFDQNKFDAAKTELTAYTLRRPNDATAWLKLGFAQLHEGGDTLPAERSFSTVLSLKPKDAEAYNGLGLANLQSGKARDAQSFFAAAVQSRPDFAAALQNLATVNLQYLHDTKAAIADYEAYLALTPRPANYNEVRDLVANLARSETTPAATAPPVIARTPTPAPPPETKPKVTNPAATTQRPAPVTRPEPEQTYASRPSQRPQVIPAPPPPSEAVASVPTQTVQVRPEPEIVTTPRPYRPAAAPAPVTNVAATQEPLEAPLPSDEQPRQGFWHRVFGYNKPDTTAKSENPENNVTPLPGTPENATVPETEAKPAPPPPVIQPITTFNRYHYRSPAKPAAGDRRSADGAFTKARVAEQDENLVDAEQWYQSAADFDPSWFEAQYNCAITAQRLANYSIALPRYEMALAIQPESVDARYNFALALKTMGYALDAAAELKKILAAHPDEVRAHLALANLYAQTIHDIPQARHHYMRVLALQPDNPHSAEIRFWLSANSK